MGFACEIRMSQMVRFMGEARRFFIAVTFSEQLDDFPLAYQ